MKSISRVIIIFFLNLLSTKTYGYRPVFLIHGIVTGSISMELIKNRIEEVAQISKEITVLKLNILVTSRHDSIQHK